jgi:hypothetical protein
MRHNFNNMAHLATYLYELILLYRQNYFIGSLWPIFFGPFIRPITCDKGLIVFAHGCNAQKKQTSKSLLGAFKKIWNTIVLSPQHQHLADLL